MALRPGLPLSIGLHAAVLCWALVSFASTPPLSTEPPPSDPIDVELLPPTDTSQQKLGDKTAKPAELIIPKDTKQSFKDSDGKRVGDTKTEEPPPPPPEQKPTPPAEKPKEAVVPPPPVEAKPEPPKPEPPKPVAKAEPAPTPPPPKPDLPKEADKAKDVGVGKPPEVKEPPKDEKALEKLLADAKPQEKPPEKKPDQPKPAAKPAPKVEPTRTASIEPSQSKPSPTPSKLNGETSDIRNRVETGTASSRVQQRASLGNPNGPNTPNVKLSQSELEALNGMLMSQIKRCYSAPMGAGDSTVKVTLQIDLNQDGTLKSDPVVEMVTPASNPNAPTFIGYAKRAVKRCASEQPFKLPVDKYAAWSTNHVTFDPNQQ